jgi:hypothetical protein
MIQVSIVTGHGMNDEAAQDKIYHLASALSYIDCQCASGRLHMACGGFTLTPPQGTFVP